MQRKERTKPPVPGLSHTIPGFGTGQPVCILLQINHLLPVVALRIPLLQAFG